MGGAVEPIAVLDFSGDRFSVQFRQTAFMA
jgi:hypothetical protein